MAGYHVLETPEALDAYKQASADLLATLGGTVYPALRDDPTNETGRHPIRCVLVFDLITFRGS